MVWVQPSSGGFVDEGTAASARVSSFHPAHPHLLLPPTLYTYALHGIRCPRHVRGRHTRGWGRRMIGWLVFGEGGRRRVERPEIESELVVPLERSGVSVVGQGRRRVDAGPLVPLQGLGTVVLLLLLLLLLVMVVKVVVMVVVVVMTPPFTTRVQDTTPTTAAAVAATAR